MRLQPVLRDVASEFVRVALDVPVQTLFEYRASGVTSADIGLRVLVPLGKKISVGIIVDIARSTTLPTKRVRSVISVQRDVPPVSGDVLELLKFCSDYYHYPIGEVVMNALPTRLRRREALTHDARSHYCMTRAGMEINSCALRKRSSAKREVLETLRHASSSLPASSLRAVSNRAPVALKALEKEGLIERCSVPVRLEDDTTSGALENGPALNVEQQTAIDTVKSAEGFTPFLLLGATGSGKTEVYLQLIARAVDSRKQALLLVPEINLTPQLEGLVRTRFPRARIASLHSGLNEGERLHSWIAAQSGSADIVLGTRLAVFTPMPSLGLIVVDEENDASFKQTSGLRYSARDLALVRAKQRGIPVILGSATPALETFQKRVTGDYQILTLPNRINAMPPQIECVDTRQERLVDGLSQTLIQEIHAALKRREQSLIFINRRGFAPVLICRDCSWTAGCQRCSTRLVLHALKRSLRCHHCGHHERVPTACPDCGNHDLVALGEGTQRVESAIGRLFPRARILRVDRDTTSRKNAWRDMREQIQSQEVDILVGTQMLAKGHDFPFINLVGVIGADNSLYSTDFRAAERLFGRLTQVAGRAGRGATRGKVLIQTQYPAHPLYQALRCLDYAAYARQLLQERKQAGFPPFMHLAVLRAEAHRIDPALSFLARAAELGHDIARAVTIFDPVPATLLRLSGMERAQLTVQARSRNALQTFLREWRVMLDAARSANVRWSIDVDPLEL